MKIEGNPAKPLSLVTDSQGYRLDARGWNVEIVSVVFFKFSGERVRRAGWTIALAPIGVRSGVGVESSTDCYWIRPWQRRRPRQTLAATKVHSKR